jgi:hypothetical protein
VTPQRIIQTQETEPELSWVFGLDAYNLILAIFLFVSPSLFAYANNVVRLEFWTSGALIAAVSAAAIAAFSEWEEWLNPALGIWLASAPWLLGHTHTRAMHVSFGAGIMVVYLAGLRLWLMHYRGAGER